jgi:ribosomal protein L24E
MSIMEYQPPQEGGGMSVNEFNAMRAPFYGKAGVCQYCGAKFRPDQTIVIVRDWDGWGHDWSAVCVGCASPEELALAKIQTSCKGCGRPMLTPHRSGRAITWTGDYRSILAQTCSARCEQRYRRKLNREQRPEIACTVCSKSFRPNRADAKFCSNACRQWAYRRRGHIA